MRRLGSYLGSISVLLCGASLVFAEQRHSVRGLILKLDAAHKSIVVSCDAISGYMDAMAMPFQVIDPKQLESLKPGMLVDFTLVVEQTSSYAENIHAHKYEGIEPDPLAARRLKLLNQVVNPSRTKPIITGESVPDFVLVDQTRDRVRLSKFSGKVVALNFVYTRCALPNFCFRSSNNFGVLQRRFRKRLGRDLVLLTITFDPVHDDPEVLAKYAQTWRADPRNWHFLTGSADDVHRVCELFGEDFFQDEGLMNHSLHTAIIDRKGKLVANLEGNEFSALQLGDFLEATLK